MLGHRGKTWRRAACLLLTVLLAPALAWAGGGSFSLAPAQFGQPLFSTVSAESSLEAQLLGERPPAAPGTTLFRPEAALSELLPGISLQERDGTAVLKLPKNFEMNISFLYGGEGPAAAVERPAELPLLFKSSLDYSLLPNLQVGLSGFLYHSAGDSRYFQRRYGDVILGMGPGIRYDLGRWSLTFQSQYGTGGRDQKEGLQNWFRVWYAF